MFIMNGVAPPANTYGAIGTRLANAMLPVDLRQRDVRINERGSAGRLGSIGNVTRVGKLLHRLLQKKDVSHQKCNM